MNTRLILLCLALPSLALSQTATTRVNTLSVSGNINQNAVTAYKLPTQWLQSDLIKAVQHYRLLPTADAISVIDTTKTASGTRINLTAAYRARPVFDRELILTVAKTGEITHIDNRLIGSPELAESQFSEAQLKSIVQNDLLKRFGPSTITATSSVGKGWVAFGNTLYPVSEFNVIDPATLKHYTVRVDESSGRVIGYRELTKD